MLEALRWIGPALLAAGAVLLLDQRSRRLGLDPPGFRDPLRRIAGLTALGLVFWVAIFAPLGQIGAEQVAVDFSSVPVWQLFLVHLLLSGAAILWYAAGFVGLGATTPGGGFAGQLGLAAPRPLREILLGLVFGVGAWVAVLASVVLIALVVAAVAGPDVLPQTPPAAIPWLAAQPILLRLALALSAGTVEELFFRGLLQPRLGIAVSTAMFAGAHLAYGQPFLLIGVTLLSVLYALLVRWRQSLWAAMTAHALFDAIQLLIVIPAVLRQFPPGGAAPLP